MNHLISTQADNAKSAQDIISDSFVRRAFDEGISSCRMIDGPTDRPKIFSECFFLGGQNPHIFF